MTYKGKVQDGVIQLEDGICLPEGTEVQIELAESAGPSTESAGKPTIGQKLAALGRWAETLPTNLPDDLAENHDHYLHGVPKRR